MEGGDVVVAVFGVWDLDVPEGVGEVPEFWFGGWWAF